MTVRVRVMALTDEYKKLLGAKRFEQLVEDLLQIIAFHEQKRTENKPR
ncbi:MAG: hypothetical protein JSS93_06680 [Bacteroidetes bacterium]|nr:hypothetical protein [Bacteroidota bacterium]